MVQPFYFRRHDKRLSADVFHEASRATNGLLVSFNAKICVRNPIDSSCRIFKGLERMTRAYRKFLFMKRSQLIARKGPACMEHNLLFVRRHTFAARLGAINTGQKPSRRADGGVHD